MAGSLGSATYDLTVDNTQLVGAFVQSKAKAEEASKAIQAAVKAQTAAIKSGSDAAVQAAAAQIKAAQGAMQAAQQAQQRYQQMAGTMKETASGFTDAARGAIGFAAAATGVAVGAAAVHAAMSKIGEETQKAAQAQFALTATFKTSAAAYTQFTAEQAAATKRTTASVQESIVAFGSLSNRYAINSEQIKELTKRSADLAAVKGITTVEAAKRLEAALRGEAESAEFLGLTLNSDYLKKFADMTAEQRRNWETLDPLIKAQITYREAIRQTDAIQGAAVKRTQEAAGASDNLATASSNLAASLGKNLSPTIATVQGGLAGWIAALTTLIEKNHELARTQPGAFHGGSDMPLITTPGEMQLGPDAGLPGSGPGPTPAQLDALSKGRSDAQIAAAKRRDAVKAALEAADKANDATVESAIRAIDRERKAKETWYSEERQRVEARRTYQIEDIEQRRDAELKRIADVAQAQKDADAAAIEDAERRKKLDEQVISEAHDQAVTAIKSRADELKRSREIEDREIEDARRAADQRTKAARELEDHERETAHQAQMRRIEDEHQEAVRSIESEIEADRDKSEKALRNLDRRADREDERHRKALRNIDDEADRALSALQTQIDALDAAQRSDDNADRIASLQKGVTAAQQGVTLATGTGTPEEIAAARAKLTAAIRLRDVDGERKAREELNAIAGQGAEAVKKANEDLSKALDDLRDEQVKESRDAEKEKLKAAQDAIRQKADDEKRDEDDRSRRRKQDIDESKQAERDKLADKLDKLETAKRAEAKAHDDTVERLNDEHQELTRKLRLDREAEDEALADTRRSVDRFRDDNRASQDADLAQQRAAIDASQEDQRRDLEAHYNGPNGVITQLKISSEEHARQYSRQAAIARSAFEAERKAAELVYANPEGTGLLQNLEKARASEMAKLEASRNEWQEWSKAASDAIKAAMADLDEFIKRGANVPRIGGDNEAQRSPGSGNLTSTSDETTRSNRTGRKYQGDLSTWLNDAMDITGVPDSWLPGLQRLVSLESSGDPGAQNKEDVIDPVTGRNLGKAKGLLQMLDDTFRSYRVTSLPNDVFDPVANAAASIQYIKKQYGNVNNIRGLYDGTFRGYDAGGTISEPSYLVSMRTGQAWGGIAEHGPERVIGRAQTAAMMGGNGSAASTSTTVVNFNGLTYDKAFREYDRMARRRDRDYQNLRGRR